MDTKIPMKTPPKSLFNYLKGGVGNDPPSSVSIDLETYSSVDIGDCGVYRYVESPDFEILLFGYAFDDEEAEVIDLTQMLPEEIDEFKNELKELFRSGIRVRAWNANFEHTCLSHWLGYSIPLDNWWDTMITAAVCGLPRSLKDVGKVLGMSEEDAKMREGTMLVRYFCVPCKPTKANRGRTRNRRSDAPEKWQKFVEYNKQDVVAERAIWRKIKRLEPSEDEHDVWMLDQAINDRGVMCDRVLAENAVKISEAHTADLMAELKDITGLENPNSVQQLGGWLEMPRLDKESVAAELEHAVGNRKRALEIRQEIGKSSIKKYEAMLNYACQDDRCRGLFQFYGANRSGRWAGRGVQLQNLPQNHLTDLDEARSVVRSGNYEAFEMLYDVPATLSELIRTAFIPKPGHIFAVADFSAIEARVVAWLANEKWRMDLFASGGDIYCQSASRMFGVEVVKGGINGHLRAKGKVSELACGYGGSVGAMINMGALKMGLTEEELPDIVAKWREASPHIVDLWWELDNKIKSSVDISTEEKFDHGIECWKTPALLHIKLPSGRCLRYYQPRLEPNRFGGVEVTYQAYDSGKWSRVGSYGPKFLENITQAVARDCLVEAMLRVSKRYPDIVMHVHDEMIVEVPEEEGEAALKFICDCMGEPISWAEGLLLRGDGYLTKYYRKD